MLSFRLLISLLLTLASSALARSSHRNFGHYGNSGPRIHLTALVLELPANRTAFQCWEFPIHGSAVDHVHGLPQLDLANINNAKYDVFPPGFRTALHTTPAIQFIHFMTGIVRFGLPDPFREHVPGAVGQELYIRGGPSAIIVAADTIGTGHYTSFPGTEPTLALTLPFASGQPPEYRVLKNGPCASDIGRFGY